MPEKVSGIVLDSFKYKETSLIARIYTEQHGLLSILVNGVRTLKAKTSLAYFQHLSSVEFSLYYKERSSLFKGDGFCMTKYSFDTSAHISKTAIAMFVSEIVLRTTKEREKDDNLFALLDHVTFILNTLANGIQDLHLYFLFHYSEVLGISLDSFRRFTDYETGQQDLEMGLDILAGFSENGYQPMGFSKELRGNLLKWILKYYEQHLGAFSIKSLDILEDVFAD